LELPKLTLENCRTLKKHMSQMSIKGYELRKKGKLTCRAKTAQVACSYCHLGLGEYLINCGQWVKDMETTIARRHLGVLRAQLHWFLETPNPQLQLQDTGGIPSPRTEFGDSFRSVKYIVERKKEREKRKRTKAYNRLHYID
jgi:hypothetical protein